MNDNLSLHPGGLDLTIDAFNHAMIGTAVYRNNKNVLLAASRNKKSKLKVLDVGCSIGTSLSALKKEFSIDAFGIDNSSEAIKKAKELHPDISFETCDASYLPFNDNSFDGIISECMLTLLKDPKEALCEWKRVLKQGGFLIISGLCEREGDDIQYAFRPEYPYDVNTSVLCKNGLLLKDALRSFAQFNGLSPIFEKDCREELIRYMAQSIMDFGSLEERIKKEQSETGSSVLDCSYDYDSKKVSYMLMILKKA